MHSDLTLLAAGNRIIRFRRGKQDGEIGSHEGRVAQLLVVGDSLFSYGEDGVLGVWDVKGDDCAVARIDLAEIDVTALGGTKRAARVTAMMHPHTYLNKLLLADEDGQAFLVNVRSGKLVYRFASLGAGITAAEQSPAVDVVALGLADGRVVVRNLKFDETVLEVSQADGAVTDLSFRSDGFPALASASSSGGVHIWHLEKRRLLASLPQAHDAMVSTSRFLEGEPVLLTTGGDNAVKMWIFDQEDGSARLLRARNGHSAPPSKVRYYSTHTILSAGLDRSFRIFSTIQDQQSRELSQGHITKKAKHLHVQEQDVKLPPVLDFAAAPLREADWANVLTCHHDDPAAYTWRYRNAVLGKHILRPPALDKAARAHELAAQEAGEAPIKVDPLRRGPHRVPGQVVDPDAPARAKGGPQEHQRTRAKCVCVTACGNYGVVGYTCGRIDRYNMQSGAHRGTYWLPAPQGHEGGVFGVAVTALNEELISGAFDGTIKIWDFESQALLHTMTMGSPVSQLTLNRDNLLLAVACDDLHVLVVDLSSRRLVRDFAGHSNRITDVAVSPDGRWLLSASADCTLRVHDIPTARLLDWVRFDKAVTGVSVGPSGDFIATSHADSVGIFLWANRTHFANIFLGFTPPASASALALPSSAGPAEADDAHGDTEDGIGLDGYPVLSEQLAPALVTFSTVARARWQTLANLDLVKQRNKPVQPPEAPKQAPFFLPTLPGLEPVFAPEAAEEVGGDDRQDSDTVWGEEGGGGLPLGKDGGRVLNLAELRASSKLVKALQRGAAGRKKDFSATLALLAGMSPSGVDLEIRSLSLSDGGLELALFLDFLATELPAGRNFELLQAYLAALLRVHEDALRSLPALAQRLAALRDIERATWLRLKAQAQKVLCLVGALAHMQ